MAGSTGANADAIRALTAALEQYTKLAMADRSAEGQIRTLLEQNIALQRQLAERRESADAAAIIAAAARQADAIAQAAQTEAGAIEASAERQARAIASAGEEQNKAIISQNETVKQAIEAQAGVLKDAFGASFQKMSESTERQYQTSNILAANEINRENDKTFNGIFRQGLVNRNCAIYRALGAEAPCVEGSRLDYLLPWRHPLPHRTETRFASGK